MTLELFRRALAIKKIVLGMFVRAPSIRKIRFRDQKLMNQMVVPLEIGGPKKMEALYSRTTQTPLGTDLQFKTLTSSPITTAHTE
jgi:hypothetical protein